ncbi:hypothetical protein PIIN_09805 [Serendipita indica DSM 11827]|uniref:Uncharacterized protein n=1 Tax=Serendipita indica (strain DSM 11827) TaxID=1109443 RepID=G4TWX4_SERID|nr:hypothetical protein PIIN_09805 [Serendipita indica DSM 11827]
MAPNSAGNESRLPESPVQQQFLPKPRMIGLASTVPSSSQTITLYSGGESDADSSECNLDPRPQLSTRVSGRDMLTKIDPLQSIMA